MMSRIVENFMNRTPNILILLAGLLCLAGVSGDLYATDPAPAATAQKKISVTAAKEAPAPEPAPAPVVSSAQVVPAVAAAQAPAPVSGDDTISLDFKDADITSVLRVLSLKSNVNIVTGPEVVGLVTVRLDNVPWEKALEVILRTYDYVYERDGNIIRVTTRDKMKLEPVETKTFILNYSKATEIQASVADILTERGRIKTSERTNMLVVTDIPTNLYRIGEIIRKLDQITTQAFIDSKVIRTQAGMAENMGIEWNPTVSVRGSSRPTTFPFTANDASTPTSLTQFFPQIAAETTATPNSDNSGAFPNPIATTGTSGSTTVTAPTFNYGTLDFSSFSATLEFLKTSSNTKVVSNPRVVVLNNQTAHIQVGSQVPLPTYERNETTGSMVISGFSYRDTGVVLNVTPHINSAEEILVDLKPEVSSEGDSLEFGDGVSAPRFDVTQVQTQLLIHSGQTIAIGGLLTDNVNSSETKVPYLGDMPLVGKLFRSKRQSPGTKNDKIETLFFVTVTTVDTQGQPAVAKVDGKNNQSQDDQAQPKTAATDAAPGLKGSEKKVVSGNANKDKPV
jgi:type IV pilus assembly protein PilQ